MAIKFTSAALCLLLPLVAAIPADQAAQESALALMELAGQPVTITGLDNGGSGCPSGSVHPYISPDLT